MTRDELARYLERNIPLTRALAVEILELEPHSLSLRAPLAPNRNHHQTAFGGSVASLAILAGWGWLHARLAGVASGVRLVIQRHEMEYLLPIDRAFVAICTAPAATAWDRFVRTLAARGRARLELAVEVRVDADIAARFKGEYVAMSQTRLVSG